MRYALALVAAILIAMPAAAESRSKPVDRKAFDAAMNQRYPSGKGPSSTSSSRGLYKGSGGVWRSR